MRLTRTVIRCAIDIADRITNFKDVTGKTPVFFAGDDVEFQIALFYGAALIDPANISALTLVAQTTAGTGNLMLKTLAGAALNKNLTAEDWANGVSQHASISFNNAETGLTPSTTIYLEVYGVTVDGASYNETFGRSLLTVLTSGRAGAAAPPVGNQAYLTQDQTVALLTGFMPRNLAPGDLITLTNAANTYKRILGVDIDGNAIDDREAIS